MGLLRIYKVVLFIIVLLLCNRAIAQSHIKICLTGRVVENLHAYGQSFINAASLANEQGQLVNKVEIKKYFYNNGPFEPIYAYDKMITEGCSAIVGFEYLSDLLLILKRQKNTEIPIFTSYASSAKTDKFPGNVFVFMPTYDFLCSNMLNYMHEKFGDMRNVLLVTEVNRDEMRKYKDTYSSLLNAKQVKFDYFDFLETDAQFESKLNSFLKNKKYEYVFLLSGAIASAKIANIMNNHKIIFIGTENFGSSVSPTFYLRLSDKSIRSYFIRNVDFLKPSLMLAEFERLYTEKYQLRPTVLGVYTYDAVSIILNTIKNTGSISVNNILSEKYKGVSGITLKDNKFYRSDNYVILSVGKDGYNVEK